MPKHGILAAVNAKVSMANTASIDIEIRSFDDIGEEAISSEKFVAVAGRDIVRIWDWAVPMGS